MMNKEELLFKEGKTLPLVNEFYSVQGEGFHTGKAAYFIRIGGCDIGCRWCDSKITWNANMHNIVPISKIVDKVLATPAKSVVITGGEPCIYNLLPLTKLLKNHGVKTYLETSGAYEISGLWDWICVSPKTNKAPLTSSIERADELKVVIFNLEDDIAWAESQAQRIHKECFLFLQPEWSRMEKNKDSIISYVKAHPQWQLSIQTHNFLKIP